MRVLLIDHGCRGVLGACAHPDADRLAGQGASVIVADASDFFPHDAAALSDESLAQARERARRAFDRAVDEGDPDVILVLHAGPIADLAVETGVPVVIHAAASDLDATGSGRIHELIASSLGAADVVAAEDAATAAALHRDGWVPGDVDVEIVPRSDAAMLIAACRRAGDRRRG